MYTAVPAAHCAHSGCSATRHLPLTPPACCSALPLNLARCFKISADARKLHQLGIPVQTVVVSERRVGPSYFSHRRCAAGWVALTAVAAC